MNPDLVVLAYGLLGDNIPRSWGGHSGFSLSATTEMVWYGFQGVFGTPLSIVIQVVLIYIIFGVILETTGASSSLIRVAFALTGRTRGGVGHAAIVSSGLFGSMSGSVVANVVGTGTFTIPMMIKRGFSRSSAGAIALLPAVMLSRSTAPGGQSSLAKPSNIAAK